MQEIIIDYFEDIDDTTIALFIMGFLYHKPVSNTVVSKLIEKFLDDQGLTEVYLSYYVDLNNPNRLFNRCSLSEYAIIQNISSALLNLSFNRFRDLVIETNNAKKEVKPKQVRKPKLPEISKVSVLFNDSSNVHVVSNLNSEFTLCGCALEGSEIIGSFETKDLVTCSHCLEIVSYIKTHNV